MRKVVLALLLTAVGLGLLLSVKSRSATPVVSAQSSAAVPAPTASTAPASTAPSASNTATSATATSAAATTSMTGSALKNGTFTGTAVSTRFGNVQVQAVISGGKLTNVIVLQVPDRGGYEDQIVQIAVPELKTEALSAQSSNIDVISGATYTSQGYAESLQSALDQAGS